MFALVVMHKAALMAADAYNWYEEKQNGLGKLFAVELEQNLKRLEHDPYAFAKIKKQYRHVVLRKFPYVIVFEIHEQEIVVLSIFHTSRNPQKKFKK